MSWVGEGAFSWVVVWSCDVGYFVIVFLYIGLRFFRFRYLRFIVIWFCLVCVIEDKGKVWIRVSSFVLWSGLWERVGIWVIYVIIYIKYMRGIYYINIIR